MLKNPKLLRDLRLLFQSGEYEAMRVWFRTWKTEDEMIDKVLIWGMFFMPEFLRDESPPFHRDLIKYFFSAKNEYTAAPRGFSKTTIIQLCICFSIAAKLDRFIVIIEKTFTEAAEVMTVVQEVYKSKDVSRVYGFQINVDRGGTKSPDAREARGDLLISGVRIRGRGFQTSPRGLKSSAYRPSRIILDDVEEDEHIENEEQRTKYLKNYVKGVLPALDIGCHVKMFGTILHKDSLLNTMILTHGGTVYQAWDRQSGKNPEDCLLWPARWTYERLMEKKSEMMAAGFSSSAFWQEYFNDPISDEDRKFKDKWMQNTFTLADIKFKPMRTYVTIDVADGLKDGNDWTGVVVVKIDSEGNWYVWRVNRVRKDILGLVDLMFEIWQNEKPVCIGVEKKSFKDQLDSFLEEKKRELQIYPVIKELKHHGVEKGARILGALQGRFESGKIFFMQDATDNTKELKGELFDFPKARWDDLADALAYIDQIAERAVQERPKKHFQGNITY